MNHLHPQQTGIIYMKATGSKQWITLQVEKAFAENQSRSVHSLIWSLVDFLCLHFLYLFSESQQMAKDVLVSETSHASSHMN